MKNIHIMIGLLLSYSVRSMGHDLIKTAVQQELKRDPAESTDFKLEADQLQIQLTGEHQKSFIQGCPKWSSKLDKMARQGVERLFKQAQKLGIKNVISMVDALVTQQDKQLSYFVINAQGVIAAESQSTHDVGKNIKDTASPFVYENILVARESSDAPQGWAFYEWLGVRRRAYTQVIMTPHDSASKFYIIGASYKCK